MTSSDRPVLENGLPAINRLITTHDSNGKAVFDNTLSDGMPWQTLPNAARFGLGYVTNTIPVDLNESRDVATYNDFLTNKPGIVVPGGTVCRIVDAPPGSISPMHRTVSLDYGVVLEGEIELVLDSGETKLMRRGDIAVQRGTMHAWRNVTPDNGFARMLYVLQESKPVEIGDKQLGEDYGDMAGVAPSKR
jgi:quercetin dioxygenase-like cupin family protein